jgi:beta-glucosidase/6-phospho-beta-glucosidase/beta-galactosidase
VIALALLGLFAQSASAARNMEVAIQDDPVFLTQAYYDRERALQQARDLGVTRIRVNMLWANVVNGSEQQTAPVPLTYNLAQFDSMIDAAARYGIRVQLTLTGPAPAFATYNRKSGVYGPRPAMYGDFVRAVARHFKGRVDRYSI